MKKKVRFLVFLIIIIFVVIIKVYNNNSKEVVLNKNDNVNSNLVSMMIETAEGSGKYEAGTSSSYPTDGYIFNDNLSGCENGSKLEWNDDTQMVVIKGNISDKCYAYFDVYTLAKVKSIVADVTGTKLDVSVDAQDGTGKVTKYFYSIDNGSNYNESSVNTYTFTNLSKGTYTVKTYVVDSNGKKSKSLDDSAEIIGPTLASHVISQYTGTQGGNGLYYHNSSLANGAGDNSYRYAGANPNNYVCFGSEATTCPSNNLYRIIGVFGDYVKVIKSSSIGNYAWNSVTSSNTWANVSINTYLNGTFLTSLGNYSNKIATFTWKVGGNGTNAIRDVTASVAYQNEIVNPVTTNTSNGLTDFSGKVGLMYVSDYGFAASSSAWSTTLYNYNSSSVNSVNWLYLNDYQWTITRVPSSTTIAYSIYSTGMVEYVGLNGTYSIRPAFYFTPKVVYLSGTGTSSDPFRVV